MINAEAKFKEDYGSELGMFEAGVGRGTAGSWPWVQLGMEGAWPGRR